MKDLKCPVCGERKFLPERLAPEDYEYGVKADGTLAGCASCGVWFMEPMPEPEKIGSFYPQNYTAYAESQSWAMRTIFRRYYEGEARRMKPLLAPGAKVLDVGCGDGSFLKALRSLGDWKTSGLEMDAGATEAARAQGLDVSVGSLETSTLPAESFDMIRMNHVIEHFSSLEKALGHAWAALKPGGLLIGETPNAQCVDFRIFGKYWGAVHFPRHLWLFSPGSLDAVLKKQGFEKVHMISCYRTVGWTGGIQNWLVGRFRLKPPKGGRFRWYPLLIPFFLPVTVLQSLLGWSGTVEFLYRKKPA